MTVEAFSYIGLLPGRVTFLAILHPGQVGMNFTEFAWRNQQLDILTPGPAWVQEQKQRAPG
jgi:hypothetical protein